jgi:NAD-dependent dihydropyrimidine dehydrogenase PreA subunit
MFTVDQRKCQGCGICIDECPTGAITLAASVAVIDQNLCTDCGICADLCPEGAIMVIAEPIQEKLPVSRPPIEVVSPGPVPGPLHQRVLPAVGAALALAGREIVPRLTPVALDALDRWLSQRSAMTPDSSIPGEPGMPGGGGRGRRLRRRRRGR